MSNYIGPQKIEWFDASLRDPPQKQLVMITGASGYSNHKKFLTLAYIDEQYRPSHGGPLRWLSVHNDAISDQFPDGPTHWAFLIELP